MPHDVLCSNSVSACVDVRALNVTHGSLREICDELAAIRRWHRGVIIREPNVLGPGRIAIHVEGVDGHFVHELTCNFALDTVAWIRYLHRQGVVPLEIAVLLGGAIEEDGFYPVGISLGGTTHYLPELQP